MYHRYCIVLMLASLFAGPLLGRHENNTDVGRDALFFEGFGDDFLIGKSSRKSDTVKYVQIAVDQETKEGHALGSLSAYHALKNAFLTKSVLDAKPEDRPAFARDFKNGTLSETLFGAEQSVWRSEIIEARRKNLAVLYLRDKIILGLLHGSKVKKSEEFVFDFSKMPIALSLEKARVTIDKSKVNDAQLQDIRIISLLAKSVAQEIVESHFLKKDEVEKASLKDHYLVTHDDIMNTLVELCEKRRLEELPGDQERRIREALAETSLKTKESFEQYFNPFKEALAFTVVSTTNEQELFKGNVSRHKKVYAPADVSEPAPDGSWLVLTEVIDIAQKEKNDSSRMFSEEFNVPMDIHTFDFSDGLTDFEQMTTKMRCSDALEKARKAVNPLTTVLLILKNSQWFSCVVTKLAEDFWFIVTDSQNKDRSNDPLIESFVNMMGESTAKKPIPVFKDFLDKATSNDKTTKEEVVNYDAPWADTPLEELPSLNELFGGKIANEVQLILNQLKNVPTSSKKPMKLKNGLILHGPPGTGKSTIAQVMARVSGREVIYAGGGDFRTAYQGSSKAKLDDLFRKAKEVVKETGRGCVILIDEIDGTSSKLQPHGSTQEDNRAIKALITTLDQYRNDPSIFVMCTTNYPEKMDPAILRRFTSLEIPLPKYEIRRNIMNYYFRQNELEVKNGDPEAITPTFFEMLLTATEGFSGDALGDIINTAVIQARSDLTAETQINSLFRCNLVDFSHHSLLHSAANIVAFPWFHLCHWLGTHAHSEMDQHIYSQFVRHKDLKKTLEGREFEEAHRMHKISDLLHPQYLGYMIAASAVTGLTQAFVNFMAALNYRQLGSDIKNALVS